MFPRLLFFTLAVALVATRLPAQSLNGARPVRFFNLAPQAGVDVSCFGRGSAIVDLDGDGLLDLVATSAGDRSYYFRQLPGGGGLVVPQFQEMTTAWQIPQDTKQTWGVVAADFDNDGDPDLYFPCGGFHLEESNRFLRNDLNLSGRFTRLGPTEAGDAVSLLESSFGASAVDADRDGDLDLFTAAAITFTGTADQACRMLRNDGDLHFTDVSNAVGITKLGNYRHTGVGDVDNDGWPDLGVGNFGGPSRLFRNNGDGTFRELAQQIGLGDPFKNFGFVFEDFDNDGWQDVFLPQYLHGHAHGISRIFLNNQDGTFRDVSNASGIGMHEDMGHNVGDLNADGFPDIYIGAGHPMSTSYDVLYIVRPNAGSGLTLKDLSEHSRIRTAGAGRNHGTPFGDVNRDGFVDIWAVNGGPSTQPNTRQPAYLWFSEGNANRWLKAELRGVVSNRDAVGARMSVLTQDGREIHRTISAGRGFSNTDAHESHFGLGRTTRALWLKILWPSGFEQYLLDPPLEGMSKIVESVIWTGASAVIGQPLAVEASGPAGYVVEMMSSDATAFVLRPDLGGILFLHDPRSGFASATLSSDGLTTVQVPIPNDPGLIGRTLYLQARIADPNLSGGASLSNRLDLVLQ